MTVVVIDQKKAINEKDAKQITITSISGRAIYKRDFSWVTCMVGVDAVVTFNLDVPDSDFNMPISNRQGGNGGVFRAKVRNGVGVVTLNFDSMGLYLYSDKEANTDIEPGTYHIDRIYVDVVKYLEEVV